MLVHAQAEERRARITAARRRWAEQGEPNPAQKQVFVVTTNATMYNDGALYTCDPKLVARFVQSLLEGWTYVGDSIHIEDASREVDKFDREQAISAGDATAEDRARGDAGNVDDLPI